MRTATSSTVRDQLKEIEIELQVASDAYDVLLVTGSDGEIAAAEEQLARLRATHARLQRQGEILQTAEAAAEKARAKRAREEADQELARCREQASAAISALWEPFREQILELRALAHEQLDGPIRALEIARTRADELNGRERPFFPPERLTVDGYKTDASALTEQLRDSFGGTPELMNHAPLFGLLGFIEQYGRVVERDKQRPAA